MDIKASSTGTIEINSAIIRNPLVVTPETMVIDAIALMSGMTSITAERCSSYVMVVKNNQLLGIFTKRDVVRLTVQQISLDKTTIEEVMTSPVITLNESNCTDFCLVLNLLQQHHISHLPILDDHNQLVGLVTYESMQQIASTIDILELYKLTQALEGKVLELEREKLELKSELIKYKEAPIYMVGDSEQGSITDISNRKIAELTLQKLIEVTGTVTGEDFFPALVRNLAEALNVDYALVTELVGDELHTLGFYANGALQSDISFAIAHTPCEYAIRDGEYYCPSSIQSLFPDCLILGQMQADGYLAIALKDNFGNYIGNLCILHSQPFSESLRAEANAILRVFGARAGTELQRKRSDKQVKLLTQELEARVEIRTKALTESEAFNRQLIENFPIGLTSCDMDGKLIYVNSVYAKIIGRTIEECLELNYWDITPIKYAPQEIEQIRQLEKTQYYGPYEKEYIHKDGHLVPVLLTGLLVEQNEQKVIWSTVQDISLRKAAELENKLLEERLQFILTSSPAVIYTCRPDGDYGATFISNNIMGYTPDHFLNDSSFWVNNIHPDDLPKVFAELPQLFKQDRLVHEYRFLQKNGEYAWMYDELKLVRDHLGVPLEIVGYFADITERKMTESQLQQANQELERATRLKDEFLANMSHELRTPLNAILGLTESLTDGILGSVNEQQIQALQTVYSSGEHLLSLINDILDVAKIESGKMTLDLQPTSIDTLCQSSMILIKQMAMEKSIQLYSKLQQNLPLVLIDERRIRQVLINLLSNAVKFTPENGQITLEVTKFSSQDTPYLRIAVIDTGIGISQDNIKKLFQPFSQVNSALNRKYMGTGLGLALVKRIVELHNGSVRVISELDKGSCFMIELPYLYSSYEVPQITLDNELTTTAEMDSQPAKVTNHQTPLILLAEDNEVNINTIYNYLQVKGYRLQLAKNGQEAIEFAKTQIPNLILMDIQMPVINGLEAMKQIRQDPNLVNIPIIALTALAMTGDRERTLEAGANEYLTKPLRMKELATTIQRFLREK